MTPDILEENIAYIFTVEESAKQETTRSRASPELQGLQD
jgi:hypothetical protein